MITEHSAPETRQFQLMEADKRQALLGIMSTVSLVEGKQVKQGIIWFLSFPYTERRTK